ncbi:UDP-glucuronosyltransferase 1A1 isoform X3 [Callorhinchus milii]|uniref:UDP-glucuronosyltransferase 1A1 isoform X3 n=1 Tax=Callorhinchus milii TaxID=7868 RepID=UPI00045738BA|nr:UDP-glucuronosyltransferase 1A1 isoform X3 [Callorhinchus milii]|eukprot:gi/632947004/ref/XP_007888841.1/ PREDICTED: UDP-glucuronosyltransferase 1-1 isoform X3 [Callorhinchus milii]
MAFRLNHPVVCLLACLPSLWSVADSGNLLVVPVDGSHWLNIRTLIQELGRRGHSIVVVAPAVNMNISPGPHYTTKLYPVPYNQSDIQAVKPHVLVKQTFYNTVTTTFKKVNKLKHFLLVTCESLLYNTGLMRELAESAFDALLTDPFTSCGAIVAESLSLPSVHILRGLPCGLDYTSAQCPRPVSYVPRMFTGNSDRMNFLQRTANFLMSVTEPLLCYLIYSPFDELAARFLQKEVTVKELLSRGAIWLLRFDFVFEYPRPLMPNMILVGGMNCKDRKPLPEELEEFMNSSGEYGAVIFSLGSMVSDVPIETADQIAEALGQIPQKVLWRHTGVKPSTLAPNTKLMKWMPQNDLLRHPKTRAFISHGGMHGIYEAICAGVPMVLVPLFADQLENVLRIKNQNAGILIDLKNMSSRDLVEALNTVINDTRYKENMMRLSSLHKDQPVKPLDLSVHWVEFVMKHKGAEHLRPAAHELNWIQYNCLDVIGFLLAIVLVSFYLMIKCCTVCYRCLGRTKKQEKKKSD